MTVAQEIIVSRQARQRPPLTHVIVQQTNGSSQEDATAAATTFSSSSRMSWPNMAVRFNTIMIASKALLQREGGQNHVPTLAEKTA